MSELTERQEYVHDLVMQFEGNVSQAWKHDEREVGYSAFSESYKAAEAKINNGLDPAISAGMNRLGMTTIPTSGWIKEKGTDGVSVSFHFKRDSVNGTVPEVDKIEALKDAFSNIPTVERIEGPSRGEFNDDLASFYIVADQHIGLMTWGKEVEEDYDLDIGVERLVAASRKLMDLSPNSGTGIILNLGDFFHMNDPNNETPRGKNKLDVDGRFVKIILAGVAATATLIDMALEKHDRVTYRAMRGNHDPEAHLFLTIAMAERYKDNPRVTIEINPSDYFFYIWGDNLVGAHHGDKGKADRLISFMADQMAPAWGRTTWRYMWTGHIHHESAKEIGGAKWESFRTLAPRDPYSFSHAYSSKQSMQSITLSKVDGEVARNKVNVKAIIDNPFMKHLEEG